MENITNVNNSKMETISLLTEMPKIWEGTPIWCYHLYIEEYLIGEVGVGIVENMPPMLTSSGGLNFLAEATKNNIKNGRNRN